MAQLPVCCSLMLLLLLFLGGGNLDGVPLHLLFLPNFSALLNHLHKKFNDDARSKVNIKSYTQP